MILSACGLQVEVVGAERGLDAGDGLALGEDERADRGEGDRLLCDDCGRMVGLQVGQGHRFIENGNVVWGLP